MADAKEIVDQYFLEMRWRCLSLAADLDRIGRAAGGEEVLRSDARLVKLRAAIASLLDEGPERARKVQEIFSDHTAPPEYGRAR
jgi:hypothetical protein